MRRSSLHSLKFSTKLKISEIEILKTDYMYELQRHVYAIWCDILPLDINCSSKNLQGERFHTSHWLQVVYKHGSEIVRSQLRNKDKKNFYPTVKNFSVTLDNRLWDIEFKDEGEFNAFIRIRLPYFYAHKKRARTINLPIKFHKQSLKFSNNKDFKMNNSISIIEKNGIFYLKFNYENNSITTKKTGKEIGIDQGINKLISDSDGKHYGEEFKEIYRKLTIKKKGSNSYKKLIITRNHLINKTLKRIDFNILKSIYCEKLTPGVKKGYNVRQRNKNQYWTYKRVLDKLNQLCEENGVQLIEVDPAYTSQRCSSCGEIVKENRIGEIYNCSCGHNLDADTNGAKNILSKGQGLWNGAYRPVHQKKNNVLSIEREIIT